MTTDQQIALAGVAVSAIGPLALIWVAYKANKRFKEFERSLETQRRISETRFDLYKDIGFQLNDILAYFTFVGSWKEHSPQDVIQRKRELDRHVFTFAPVFSQEFLDAYAKFIRACFRTYGGWGKDARLRTTSEYRSEAGKAEWADCFTEENNQKEVSESYGALLSILANDLGLNMEPK